MSLEYCATVINYNYENYVEAQKKNMYNLTHTSVLKYREKAISLFYI